MRNSARISIKAAALIMALLFLVPAAGCIKDIKENVVVDIGVTDDPSAAESAPKIRQKDGEERTKGNKMTEKTGESGLRLPPFSQ
jgi:hypothetical protein